jgi:hypothetical protein
MKPDDLQRPAVEKKVEKKWKKSGKESGRRNAFAGFVLPYNNGARGRVLYSIAHTVCCAVRACRQALAFSSSQRKVAAHGLPTSNLIVPLPSAS